MSGELRRQRFAKGPPRPQYLESRSDDRLVMMILTLSAEVAALRERLDTHERLADAATFPSGAAVESFVPTAENEAARARNRQALIERLTRPLLEEAEPS